MNVTVTLPLVASVDVCENAAPLTVPQAEFNTPLVLFWNSVLKFPVEIDCGITNVLPPAVAETFTQ